ncbi:MAG TPA: JAB domain-containing protein [Thermodesulfobacteriota bacterium]|nr:JAB domain-containing protein [Thermodesulfobacteriota bacterium]
MTSTNTLASSTGNNLKTIRLKIIKPVYETLTIREELPDYLAKNKKITSSADVFQMFRSLVNIPRETFIALHLSNKNTIICVDVCSIGSLSASICHPRDIYIPALLSGAASTVFVHQHPSGCPEPSREDQEIATRLKEVGELIGIRTLDFIVIGDGSYVSFTDRGLL